MLHVSRFPGRGLAGLFTTSTWGVARGRRLGGTIARSSWLRREKNNCLNIQHLECGLD